LPGIYVDRIVQATTPSTIEHITLASDFQSETINKSDPGAIVTQAQRHRIAKRAAKEIKDGFYVNLGIGMPTLVPEHLDPNMTVWMQSENGILGMGPYPNEDGLDA
jgi:3-oxoacid CoA-transferase